MQRTKVVPVWIKVAGLVLLVGFFCLQFFGNEHPTAKRHSKEVITPAPDLKYGLAGKTAANTKQIASRLFSPVVEASHAPIILRTTGDKPYYQDEDAAK